MGSSAARCRLCGLLTLSLCVVGAWFLLSAPPLRSAQNTAPPKTKDAIASPAAGRQVAAAPGQKDGNPKLDATQTDAAELCALAEQLRAEIDKMSANSLAVGVVQDTERIRKLAKKIKGEANAH